MVNIPAAIASLTAASCNVAQVTPIGSAVTTTTAAAPQPAANEMHFYLAGHRSATPGALTAVGRNAVGGEAWVAPAACP